MLSRRQILVIVRVSAGLLLIVVLFCVVLRYSSYRRCTANVERAERELGLGGHPRPLDVQLHIEYLQARLAKGWLYAKRDVFLGRLLDETLYVRDFASGQHVHAGHLLPGHHVIATVSPVDGAELPTSVTVPPGWDGRAPIPMVLHLHSGGVDAMIKCFPAPEIPGALSVLPLARGSHDYLGVQMTAVEDCVVDVRRRYPVSEVYVFGTSMGGMGAWLYAQRHVGRIAGVSPWCGNADPAGWQGVWEDERPEPRSAAGGAWRKVRARRTPVARVKTLITEPQIPILIGHGTEDEKIPIGHSESMYGKLAAAGDNVRFERFDGLGHRLPPLYEERFRWLRKRSPPGWRPFKLAAPATPPDILSRSWPLGPACRVFEYAFGVFVPAGGPAHLHECARELAGIWKKRYGGEIRMLDAERLSQWHVGLVAIGSPDENPAVREALSGLDVRVEPGRAHLFGREFEGEDVGLAIMRPGRSGPSEVRTTRPGGKLKPDPVLVVWGSTPASYRQLWRRFAHDVDWEGDRGRWWFDYAVFDRKTCGPDTFLAVGFLDREWRFDPDRLFEGSAELRARIPGTHWPSGTGKRDAEGRVWLSTLEPAEVDALRGPVGFDRSAGPDGGALTIHGRRFERGIGMVPPAAAKWKLGGRFRAFRATVGLERAGRPYAIRYEAERVRFEVRGDGKLLAASRVLLASDEPVEIEADLSGVRTLELRAAAATRHLWHCGPVGWGDAALAPAE